MVKRIIEKMTFFPLKHSLAKAYPAMESNNKLIRVTPPAKIIVFFARKNTGMFLPTLRYCVIVQISGKNPGGYAITFLSVLNDDTNNHKKGNNTINAIKSNNMVDIIFPISRFLVMLISLCFH
jgi:hypothetical protein